MTNILFKRGTTSQLDQYVGKEGELVIDSENKTLRVFDGTNKGGYLISGLDVIDGGVIPEPIPTFVKRSDYNIYIVSVKDYVKFEPIMIWLRVNPNDTSKIQYYQEGIDEDWVDSFHTPFNVTLLSIQSVQDVEDVINEIETYIASPTKDDEYQTINTDEKVLLGYQDVGWTEIHKVSFAVPNHVSFNNITLNFPSAKTGVILDYSASNEIAFYQNVFEKDWIPS